MQAPRYFFESQFAGFEPLFLENGVICTFKKDTVLPVADHNYVYYIQSGIVKFSVLNENGLEKIICFHGKSAVFPYSLCLPVNNQHKLVTDFMNISAVTDLTVIRMLPNTVYRMVKDNNKLLLALTDYCIRHSNLFLFEIMNQSQNTAFIKTCNFLYVYTISLQKKGICLTQEELGEAIGESRSGVARALRKLRDDGIINTSRASIRVLDSKKLLEHCSYDDPDANAFYH